MGLLYCYTQGNAQIPAVKGNIPMKGQIIVKGHIYDSQTRQPIAGVTIGSLTAQQLALSDSKGYFDITIDQAVNHVQAVMVGYKTQLININAVGGTSILHLNVQMEADEVNLNEVRVAGYNSYKTNKETAGAVSVITAKDINRGSAVSFQAAMNTIPGVRMEQSTLSEARISIRGNGVRASFGIRNIKIYVNEIPVTEADGTTRIEALDVNSIGRAEVIKGPASSIYGAGTGGVINFQMQRSPYQEQSLEAAALTGAYGLRRLASTYRSGGDKVNSYLSYGWQEYGGYRAHSRDMRRFLTGNFQLFPSDQRIITLLLNRTTQYAQIPGALSGEQMMANPVQANATNLDKAAGRYQNWTRIGLGQQYRFSDQFSNNSSVFTYFYDLNHPLAYAYIRNQYQSYGGRTRFAYDPGFKVLPTKFSIGAEFNEGRTKGTQYVNNKGKEGPINSAMDYLNKQYSVFYQSETALGKRTALVLGLSYNSISYEVNNYLNQAQSGLKKFDPQANPRVALSHTFADALSLHASVSSGFSPPSGSEIRDVDGAVNRALQAEKGLNYELNAKGNLLKSRLSYDLAVFKMDMSGELIGQTVQQGITVYNNAGKTSHDGVELFLSYQLLRAEDRNELISLRPFVAATFSNFKFKEYSTLNAQGQVTASYDGNELTGIAPWVVNAGIDIEAKSGLYFYGSYFFSDKLPLNDLNTAFNDAYTAVNAKLGYKKRVGRHLEASLYGGVDNMLNENYSSIVALNAVGFNGAQPAYFNPSPARNGYGGVNLKYIF